MFMVGPVLLLVVIGAVVVAARLVRRALREHPAEAARPDAPADRVDAWVTEGLLTAEQAQAIRAHEGRTLPPPAPAGRPHDASAAATRARRVPAAAEALGYLGGILAVVGVVLLVARSWDTLGAGGRLAVAAGGALVLTGGGLAVRGVAAEPALARLQAFLWLLASGAVATLGAVVAADVFDTEHTPTVVLVGAAAVAVHAAALWRGRTRPLEQAVCIAATFVAVAAAVLETDNRWATGLVLYAVAAAVAALGMRHVGSTPAITATLGVAGAVVGAVFVADDAQGPGFLLLVGTALAATTIALAPRSLLARLDRVGVGTVGVSTLWWSVPATLGWFARDAGFATGFVTAVVGAAAMVAADTGHVHAPHWVEAVGGLTIVGGAALTGTQSVAFATLAGLAVAVGLVALGMLPGRVLMSVVGSIGLLVNVPWAIGWFFPGEGRAPLLILVSGALIVGVAVLLSRMGGRFRRELHHDGGHA